MNVVTCEVEQSFSPNSPDTTGTWAATGATVASQQAAVWQGWWL